jgi:hypothetical protein
MILFLISKKNTQKPATLTFFKHKSTTRVPAGAFLLFSYTKNALKKKSSTF